MQHTSVLLKNRKQIVGLRIIQNMNRKATSANSRQKQAGLSSFSIIFSFFFFGS
jgi:hypothetical protein